MQFALISLRDGDDIVIDAMEYMLLFNENGEHKEWPPFAEGDHPQDEWHAISGVFKVSPGQWRHAIGRDSELVGHTNYHQLCAMCAQTDITYFHIDHNPEDGNITYSYVTACRIRLAGGYRSNNAVVIPFTAILATPAGWTYRITNARASVYTPLLASNSGGALSPPDCVVNRPAAMCIGSSRKLPAKPDDRSHAVLADRRLLETGIKRLRKPLRLDHYLAQGAAPLPPVREIN